MTTPSPAMPTTSASDFRPRLLAIAYRMLGSAVDAEDAVQDAYLRWQQASSIDSVEGWLVKTTTRICIDRLRQAKRREQYVGPWLPEPVSHEWNGANSDAAELAESLSTAFLVLLETLSPTERAAYLLREVFNYDFEEIAHLIDKSPANVRQITTRAKRRLQTQHEPRYQPQAEQADAMAERFFAACQAGDMSQIEVMLTQDVVFYSDGGGKAFAAPQPVRGSQKVSKLLATVFRKLQQIAQLSFSTVNGQPGAIFRVDGTPIGIYTLAADADGVSALFAVINPDKLAAWNTSAERPSTNLATSPTTTLAKKSVFKGEPR